MGLNLLTVVLALPGVVGIGLLLLSRSSLADVSEVNLLVARVPLPLALAGLFCVGMVFDSWRRWQVKRLTRQGWERLLDGRPDAAIRAFKVAAYGGNEDNHGLALAWLRNGDYERAISQCEASPSKGTERPALMALILALYGELDDARTWVQAIRRPMFDQTDYALLAQAVMLCREGKYVEAVKRIQGTAREHVPELDVGAVAVIHAFARSRLGGQLVPLKPGCVLPEKPVRASDYEYLAREWPEFAAFLRGEKAPVSGRGA